LPDHRKPAGLTIVDELAAHRVVRTPGQRDISHIAIVRWFLITKDFVPFGQLRPENLPEQCRGLAHAPLFGPSGMKLTGRSQ
jgi:hypothetical protein